MESKPAKSLGQTLKEARQIIGFTLRQVEEPTGISNAYLSQLENDKIKKSSANVLHKLASIYGIPLNDLLGAAGIIENHSPYGNQNLLAVFGPPNIIAQDEQEELIRYLQFIRWKKKTNNHHGK